MSCEKQTDARATCCDLLVNTLRRPRMSISRYRRATDASVRGILRAREAVGCSLFVYDDVVSIRSLDGALVPFERLGVPTKATTTRQ